MGLMGARIRGGGADVKIKTQEAPVHDYAIINFHGAFSSPCPGT